MFLTADHRGTFPVSMCNTSLDHKILFFVLIFFCPILTTILISWEEPPCQYIPWTPGRFDSENFPWKSINGKECASYPI